MNIKIINDDLKASRIIVLKDKIVLLQFLGFKILNKKDLSIYWDQQDLFSGCECLISEDERYLAMRDSTSLIRIYDILEKKIVKDIEINSRIGFISYAMTNSLDDGCFYITKCIKQDEDIKAGAKLSKGQEAKTEFEKYEYKTGTLLGTLDVPNEFDYIEKVNYANCYLLASTTSNKNFYKSDEKGNLVELQYLALNRPIVDNEKRRILISTMYGVRVLDENLNEINGITLITSKQLIKSPINLLDDFQAVSVKDLSLSMSFDDDELDQQAEEIVSIGFLFDDCIYAVTEDFEKRRTYFKVANIETSEILLDISMGFRVMDVQSIDKNHIVIYSIKNSFVIEVTR